MTKNSQLNWNWVGRYVAVIVAALVLAAVIGEMPLFGKTFLVSGKLSAAQVVRFLGYGTALIVFWILGQRLTIFLRQQQGSRWSASQNLILPIVTFIVVSALYSVILLVMRPLMDVTLQKIYDWMFILAIIACAIWLIMALLGQSDALTEALIGASRKRGSPDQAAVCASCGASNDAGAIHCGKCGKELTVGSA
jgi:eukaryotic-like serine/threonine-protein kinase